jgi:hypothetical protein
MEAFRIHELIFRCQPSEEQEPIYLRGAQSIPMAGPLEENLWLMRAVFVLGLSRVWRTGPEDRRLTILVPSEDIKAALLHTIKQAVIEFVQGLRERTADVQARRMAVKELQRLTNSLAVVVCPDSKVSGYAQPWIAFGYGDAP